MVGSSLVQSVRMYLRAYISDAYQLDIALHQGAQVCTCMLGMDDVHNNDCVVHTERVKETYADTLRSVLAQLEYMYQVLKHEAMGVHFRTHLYVPEINSITGAEYHERG